MDFNNELDYEGKTDKMRLSRLSPSPKRESKVSMGLQTTKN